MDVTVVDHPLIAHKVTLLRAASTDSPTFVSLTNELVTLLAYEATRDIRVVPVTVETPLEHTTGVHLAQPRPLIVPILRAGLGMLPGMRELLPSAEVGFVGAVRDEATLQVTIYGDRLPTDLTGRQVYVVDPMLATGGTLLEVLALLVDRGATDITIITLLAAPEGIARLEASPALADVRLTAVCAAMDRGLNAESYIVPGLGDAGDRLFGRV